MQTLRHRFLTFKPWTRHGAILVVAGFAYILIGIVQIASEPSESHQEALYYALHVMSMDGWGMGFVTIGLIALISSRWPNWSKAWGYTVLTGWSAAWSSFYFAGGLLTETKILYLGTAGLWALLAFLWWAVSGMVSPPKNEGEP